MLKEIHHSKSIEKNYEWLLLIFLISSTLIALITDKVWIMALPVALFAAVMAFLNIRWIYFLLIFCIPFSVGLQFGSLTLDFPDEAIAMFFFAIAPVAFLMNYKKWDFRFLYHPIVFILIAMFFLSILATINSTNVLLSIKYLLAKGWYLVAYFACTALFLRSVADVRKMSWFAVIACLLTVLYVMSRHAADGFSFVSINKMVGPFYSNHVSYAVQIVVIVPFLWFLWRQAKGKSMLRWFLIGLLALFIVATYFSYTRAAILTLVLSIGFYFVIRMKLVKWFYWAGVIGAVIGTAYLVDDDHFFTLAPDYNKTITQTNFDDLLSATYNMEDISTMERLYRWVAARYMIPDRPLLGVGPNNFYDTYKPYTLNSFRTYVSKNPEQSTVHSYLLLLMIEQGVFAALLYLALIYYAFVTVQRLYHSVKNRAEKDMIIAAGLCFFNLVMVLLINDVVESDKEGSFFYISLAIIAAFHFRWLKSQEISQMKKA
jgi:O-antigen ligase